MIGELIRRGVGLWLPCLFCLTATAGFAQPADESPTDRALGDTNWYDPELDRVVPIEVDPVVDDSINRSSRWLPKPERVKKAATNNTGGGAGGGFLGSGLSLGNLFGWMLLGAIVVGCVALLLYTFSKAEIDLGSESRGLRQVSVATDEQTLERMKHLPAELRRTDVNLRSEAERLMNEGKFDQAIILLFAHQLLLLDRAGMLRLNRGKTNGKYYRETRAVDRGTADRLRATINAFERSYFGRHEIDRDEFGELWASNAQLEASVHSRQEQAA